MRPPDALDGQVVSGGPERRRHELLWTLALPDGRRAVLAQLVPELARDPALRRRYVYEAEKLARVAAACLPPTLASGPSPDPRDPAADPPWRVRLDPPGEDLEALLRRRAPLPVDEALALMARVAEAVHGLHAAGLVARDLEPARIRLGDGGAVWLIDVGGSRFAVLSSRTASSMLLESSPYAAPEHLRTTLVDPRTDVYSLGVMLWRALTGELPLGDAHQVLLGGGARAPLTRLRPEVPASMAAAIEAAIDAEPDHRPASPRELAQILRGERAFGRGVLERVTCQACGQPLPSGLRLCLSCGREAVQLRHVPPGQRRSYTVELKSAREDEAFDTALREELELLAGPAERHLAFIVGDRRMYSKEERARRIATPAPLFTELSEETAIDLRGRLVKRGLKVRIKRTRSKRLRRLARGLLFASGAALAGGVAAFASQALVLGSVLMGAGMVGLIGGIGLRSGSRKTGEPVARLREAPAALPASDPLVARLAGCLSEDIAADLRERVAQLALVTQRLVDVRAGRSGDGEVELALAPVAEVVELAAGEIDAVRRLDRELGELDEGALVRALVASEARGEPDSARRDLLAGLDRLRDLEERRALGMRRLLEAASLLGRILELAGATGDPDAEADRLLEQARAELEAALE